MTKLFNSFFKNDGGAITTEWLVLGAAAVALSVAAFDAFKDDDGELHVNVDPDTALETFVAGF